jgi:hypothetical protein
MFVQNDKSTLVHKRETAAPIDTSGDPNPEQIANDDTWKSHLSISTATNALHNRV